MNIPRVKLTHQKILVVAIVAVVLTVFGLVAWMLWTKPDERTSGPVTQPQSIDSVVSEAMTYSDNGDVDGGLEFYDQKIEQSEDKSEKKQLLLHKASFAQQAERHDEAVAATKRADEIASDFVTAEAMARAYESSGDKEKALFYYKKTLELAPKEGMESRYNSIWEAKIAELEQ